MDISRSHARKDSAENTTPLQHHNTSRNTFVNLKPLILTAIIVGLDQASKFLIVKYVPRFTGTPFVTLFNDFFWIIHIRNRGAVFSLGDDSVGLVRALMLYILPLLLLAFLVFTLIRSDWTRVQRYCVAGILGGGLGNLIDRFFRPDGVVDFASVRFYGIFGWNRWPTFNIADSSIVISMIVWFVSLFFIKHLVTETNNDKTISKQ